MLTNLYKPRAYIRDITVLRTAIYQNFYSLILYGLHTLDSLRLESLWSTEFLHMFNFECLFSHSDLSRKIWHGIQNLCQRKKERKSMHLSTHVTNDTNQWVPTKITDIQCWPTPEITELYININSIMKWSRMHFLSPSNSKTGNDSRT